MAAVIEFPGRVDSFLRDSEGRMVWHEDIATVDGRRDHEFIEHGYDRRCYVCRNKRSAEVHQAYDRRVRRQLAEFRF